jgi:hypothetical protein
MEQNRPSSTTPKHSNITVEKAESTTNVAPHAPSTHSAAGSSSHAPKDRLSSVVESNRVPNAVTVEDDLSAHSREKQTAAEAVHTRSEGSLGAAMRSGSDLALQSNTNASSEIQPTLRRNHSALPRLSFPAKSSTFEEGNSQVPMKQSKPTVASASWLSKTAKGGAPTASIDTKITELGQSADSGMMRTRSEFKSNGDLSANVDNTDKSNGSAISTSNKNASRPRAFKINLL